jgi:hypothetical protein
VDLSREEVAVLRKLLERSIDDTTSHWDEAQAARIMAMDPVAATLTQHYAWMHSEGAWACACNNKPAYVSKNHCILTHIRPIVEKAATQKVRGILERADMDLDAMLLTDKIFGEPAQKRDDMIYPSEHKIIRQRQQAMRLRYCEHGNDINQPCRQCP